MFNFLKGKKTNIAVAFDRPTGIYYPGEMVGITVEILPEKDLKLKKGVVSLNGAEQYEYTTTTSSTDSEGNTTEDTTRSWGYNNFFTSEERFVGEATLPGGASQRYTFQESIPLDAMASCAGKILRVEWNASVKLDRPLAGDLHASAGLTVCKPAPGQDMQPGEYGESNEPGEAELALILPGLEVSAGQQFSGQLRIMPHKDFTCEVRLELVCDESVSYDEGNYSQRTFPFNLAGRTDLIAWQQKVIPFQIAIPTDAAPTCDTPHGSISWKIKGILNRRLRKDTFVEQGISVFSAR